MLSTLQIVLPQHFQRPSQLARIAPIVECRRAFERMANANWLGKYTLCFPPSSPVASGSPLTQGFAPGNRGRYQKRVDVAIPRARAGRAVTTRPSIAQTHGEVTRTVSAPNVNEITRKAAGTAYKTFLRRAISEISQFMSTPRIALREAGIARDIYTVSRQA